MKHIYFLISLLLWINSSFTTIIMDFELLILSKAFDRSTGSLYIGVQGKGIFKIPRSHALTSFDSVPFNQAANTFIINATVLAPEFLAYNRNAASPFLAAVQKSAEFLSQKFVYALAPNGTPFGQSPELLDASGLITSGITDIAAGKQFIFATVKPTGPSSNFGDDNSGIAVVHVNYNAGLNQGFTLQQTAAQMGDPAIQAKKLDSTITEVGAGVGTGNPTITSNSAVLYYDYQLDRLYTGLTLTTSNHQGDAAFGVVVADVNASGVLNFQQIAPTTAFSDMSADEIVGVINNEATSQTITLQNIAVMHTSSGPDYLIVTGGNGTAGNTVYALPLVNDPINITTHGTLADKNSSLGVNNTFVSPATTPAQMTRSTDVPAMVGTRPLPLQAANSVADLIVVGDAVYVSLDVPADSDNDNGIFFSQALFDVSGKIKSWTPWSKKAFIHNPPFTKVQPTNVGQISLFDVDAVTGKIYAVEGSVGQELAQTSWASIIPPQQADLKKTFTARVNSFLFNGSLSVLDLDQSTHALGTGSPGRYALLGGVNKVLFLKTSVSEGTIGFFAVDGSGFTQRQTIITDFADPQNYLETTLPKGSGCVTSLEFSRRTAPDQNYFFAGTEEGLFVFAQGSQTGFSLTNNVNNLNAPPFTTGVWRKAPTITGSIIGVKTSGIDGENGNGGLYVLTLEPTCSKPFNYKLYRIPFSPTVQTMFSPDNIYLLAESGVGNLKDATLFTDFTIMSLNTSGTSEELVISTNRGLYRSNAHLLSSAGIVDTVSQAQARWELVNVADTALYTALFNPDYPVHGTVWPVQIGDNRCRTFELSNIMQLANNSEIQDEFNFEPGFFNAITQTPPFLGLDPITYFYTDGGRRFFVIESQNCRERMQIMSLPFDTAEWNVTNPAHDVIGDTTLQPVKRFFWLSHLGVTGIFAAGTEFGVVVLQ